MQKRESHKGNPRKKDWKQKCKEGVRDRSVKKWRKWKKVRKCKKRFFKKKLRKWM